MTNSNTTDTNTNSPTRKDIRNALLGKGPKPDTRVIELFGFEIELRQPSLGDIMRARETEDPAARAADMIIKYAYVPGTNERVFDDADRDQILKWPFGKDLARLNTAIVELTGVDIEEAEKDLKTDPLGGQS